MLCSVCRKIFIDWAKLEPGPLYYSKKEPSWLPRDYHHKVRDLRVAKESCYICAVVLDYLKEQVYIAFKPFRVIHRSSVYIAYLDYLLPPTATCPPSHHYLLPPNLPPPTTTCCLPRLPALDPNNAGKLRSTVYLSISSRRCECLRKHSTRARLPAGQLLIRVRELAIAYGMHARQRALVRSGPFQDKNCSKQVGLRQRFGHPDSSVIHGLGVLGIVP
jgi:hypothetical protein